MKLLLKRLSLFAFLAVGGWALANCRNEGRGHRDKSVVAPLDEGTGGSGAVMERIQQSAPDTAHAIQAPPNVGGSGISQPPQGIPNGVGEDVPDNEYQGPPSAVGFGVGGSGMDGGQAVDGGVPNKPGRPKAGKGR